MDGLRRSTALVTGASGGIGSQIVKRLAREGVKLAVSGRRLAQLQQLCDEIAAAGGTCVAVPADLSDQEQLRGLIDRAQSAVGPIDVLINNAGVESIGAFTSYTEEELRHLVEVNLTAPMLLTSAILPGMLQRGRGHVVFISSLAGKIGPAYNEPYAASKAGLVGLTQSLRAEYLRKPVGFSVICPGFTAGEGMYQRMADEGHTSNRLIGETSTEKVADAVVRAILKDVGEIVESGAPIRPMLALAQVAPRLVERVAPRFGATGIFQRAAQARGRG